ncbi:hypothetical protein EIP91_000087 [Steccherinum ochraceum]|uniref:Uncharacterized protein n=1 Tax=Steccherinum ochraceum TaxID=92696 RepID=A0A4R0RXY2_9APHY|nr:hypothetical protein EIP91_000087 [Steccherinum ochraceum]
MPPNIPALLSREDTAEDKLAGAAMDAMASASALEGGGRAERRSNSPKPDSSAPGGGERPERRSNSAKSDRSIEARPTEEVLGDQASQAGVGISVEGDSLSDEERKAIAAARRWVSSPVRFVIGVFKRMRPRRPKAASARRGGILPMSAPKQPKPQQDDTTQSSNLSRELDAPCVEWLLVTSTDPDSVITAARMVSEVNWRDVKADLGPMMRQLTEAFVRCFSRHPTQFSQLLPFSRDRAIATGQAILSVYMDKMSTTQPIQITADVEWLRRWSRDPFSEPDLDFICDALVALLLPVKEGQRFSVGDVSEILDVSKPRAPHSWIVDWFSQRMLHCIDYRAGQRTRPSFIATIVSYWLSNPSLLSAHAYADCMLACSLIMDTHVPLRILLMDNRSDFVQLGFTQAVVELSEVYPLRQPQDPVTFERLDEDELASIILFKPLVQMLAEVDPANVAAIASLHRFVKSVIILANRFNQGSSVTASYLEWILPILEAAMVSTPPTFDSPSNSQDQETTYICLQVLSQLPDVLLETHDDIVFKILPWTLTHDTRLLRHAGLKLLRALCGEGRDVTVASLAPVVEGMGGIVEFCKMLSASAPVLYGKTTVSRQRGPAYYLWISAFLDIVQALASNPEWRDHIMDLYALQCLRFADYLRSPVGLQKWNEPRSPARFLGWDSTIFLTRDEYWSTSTFGFYQNIYVRDMWRRVIQILLLCEMHRPGFIVDPGPPDPSRLDLKLVIICTPWQICDTHAIPDVLLPAMVDYTGEVVGSAGVLPVVALGQATSYFSDVTRVLGAAYNRLDPGWLRQYEYVGHRRRLKREPLWVAACELLPLFRDKPRFIE